MPAAPPFHGFLRVPLLSLAQPPVTMSIEAGWGELAGGLDTMSRRGRAGFLRAGTALGLLVIATAQASAGGFGIREQSAYGQGTSFAGIAAGGALSSMFWNPATMTQVPGIQSESVVSGLIPYARAHSGTRQRAAVRRFGGTTNTGRGGVRSGELSVLPVQSEPLARAWQSMRRSGSR